MMRISGDLTDREAFALRIFSRAMAHAQWLDRLQLRDALSHWDRIPWKAEGFSESDVESSCSKLASFGLVARLDLPPNQNALTPLHNGYELLQKGRRFVTFVRQQTDQT